MKHNCICFLNRYALAPVERADKKRTNKKWLVYTFQFLGQVNKTIFFKLQNGVHRIKLC